MGFGIWDLGFGIWDFRGNPQIDFRFLIWDFKGNSQIDRLARNQDISASASAGCRSHFRRQVR
ncbi:MAG: hypothetical protein EAZ90_20000 [Oscillatoriales cyanobacterium]|nr:MAG: hypothetical protein EAZ90_20000 [Oscillatoriales cyanobacterium]TAF89939.1 MAG: hypothetical protein EAZ49_10780 [Oscillatoriales cyanobacterium]TAG06670.1 MAG: hypothetical protein EAZ45_03950 [Oscillatoriales cyanobacterium]TAG16222.1 MAG: hypothetical protein EAZ39_17725 [Oscillatoriales cyanobacterium]TAG44744.1 MAG: hypothetical protein EAZ33_09525 [Oscillatoriales cyanobacterium]